MIDLHDSLFARPFEGGTIGDLSGSSRDNCTKSFRSIPAAFLQLRPRAPGKPEWPNSSASRELLRYASKRMLPPFCRLPPL